MGVSAESIAKASEDTPYCVVRSLVDDFLGGKKHGVRLQHAFLQKRETSNPQWYKHEAVVLQPQSVNARQVDNFAWD